MKILIAFAGDMNGSGGMQHACMTLAGGLASRGHHVVIAYGDTSQGDPFYPLPDGVVMKSFGEFAGVKRYGTLGSQISSMDKLIRECIRPISRKKAREWNQKSKAHVVKRGILEALKTAEPDVVISFGADTSYYLLAAHCQTPMMTLFRVEPKYVLSIAPKQEIEAVRQSALVQVQLPFFTEQVESYCGPVKTVVIPNPVRQIEGQKQNKSHVLINAARIDKQQKRQHVLLEAFALAASSCPDWTLEFWGTDKNHESYRDELLKRIKELHLENRVFLKGSTKDMESVYQRASIFGFPSAFEGFPNALAEAMAHGLPVVAMKNCPSSAALITEGKDGCLAENVQDMAQKLKELMKNEEARDTMGKAAKEAMQAYAPEKIWDQWEQAMEQAVSIGRK
jgi:glycosyltransferase involved in cell wall biosynthesis